MKILNTEIPDWLVWLSAGLILYELGKRLEAEPGEAETLETDLEGDVMTCAAWQALQTEKGPIVRCLYYEPTCADGKCRTEPVPYPPSVVEMLEKRGRKPPTRKTAAEEEAQIEKDIKSVSMMMAKDANDALDEGKELYRQILAHGGLRQERGGHGREEFENIPKHLHRKSGTTIDDMATEMGYKDGDELYMAIMDDKFRRAEMPGGRRYFRSDDFFRQAEQYVLSQSQAA